MTYENPPVWVIEKDVFNTKMMEAMVSWLENNDVEHHVVRVKPFVHEIEGEVPNLYDRPVVVYGSIGAQKLAERHYWYPGIWTGEGLNEDALRTELGRLYLNHDVETYTFKTLFNANSSKVPRKFFVKPNTDTKEFAGFVSSPAEFKSWYEKMLDIGYLDESILSTELAVSSVKKVGCEWRLLIVDGKVADYSIYRQYQTVMTAHECPDEVIQFAEICARRWSPYPVFGLDVCESEEGYSIVEYNCFNSMGLYAMDIPTVMKAVTDYVKERYS